MDGWFGPTPNQAALGAGSNDGVRFTLFIMMRCLVPKEDIRT